MNSQSHAYYSSIRLHSHSLTIKPLPQHVLAEIELLKGSKEVIHKGYNLLGTLNFTSHHPVDDKARMDQ